MSRVRTKIICTMGPSVASYSKLIEMIDAGMDVARLNFSHGSHETHAAMIELLKKVRNDAGIPLAIMLDTKGPEIRLRQIPGGEISVKTGDRVRLVKEATPLPELPGIPSLPITPAVIIEKIELGMHLLFDDGCIASHIVEKGEGYCLVEIDNNGLIRSGKGVNVPELVFDMPAISQKDIDDIRFGARHGVDLIAASFVRSADDVLSIRRLLEEEGMGHILILAKIENLAGVENVDSIIQVSDGLMVARGDLGVEVPISQVPQLQKMMIKKCYLAGKTSVTATQMLESMISSPRPTRAEASDVANAVYDSTSAVMLSAETAIGKYPVETVRMMKSIIREAEQSFNYREFFMQHSSIVYHDVPSAVTFACVKAAYSMNGTSLFCFTASGRTGRLITRLRPSMTIVALTPEEKVYHQLAIEWGIIPCLSEPLKTLREAFLKLSEFALEKELVAYGDLVVVSAGSPFGISGTTNMMLIESIGDVLVRGYGGIGEEVHGNVAIVYTSESRRPYQIRGRIIVLPLCDESFYPLVEEAKAVILHNQIHDHSSEEYLLEVAKKLNKPALIRADGAREILKEGQLITLDPQKGLVYKGVVSKEV